MDPRIEKFRYNTGISVFKVLGPIHAVAAMLLM